MDKHQRVTNATVLHSQSTENSDSLIAALLVVGFHHAHGPIVEFCVPPLPQQNNSAQQKTLEKLTVPEEWSFLPFLALPGIIAPRETLAAIVTDNRI